MISKKYCSILDAEANTVTRTRTELDAPPMEECLIEEGEVIVEDFRVVHVDVEIFVECVLEVEAARHGELRVKTEDQNWKSILQVERIRVAKKDCLEKVRGVKHAFRSKII